MITFKRDGTKVQAHVETGNEAQQVMRFDWETGREFFASVIVQMLNKRRFELVQAARQEAYAQGYRDGRAKKAKATWQSGNM